MAFSDFTEPHMKIVFSPSSSIQKDLKRILANLSQRRYQGANKLTLDLTILHELTPDAINLIIALYQECDDQDVDFEVVNACPDIYKSLIHASLEFLDVVSQC